MKTHVWMHAALGCMVITLAGCAAGPNQQLGAAGGAIGGAVIGNAIGGNTASTVGGAAIGGLIGNEVGRQADQRNYDQQRGYYPQQPSYPPQQYPQGNSGPYYGPRY